MYNQGMDTAKLREDPKNWEKLELSQFQTNSSFLFLWLSSNFVSSEPCVYWQPQMKRDVLDSISKLPIVTI